MKMGSQIEAGREIKIGLDRKTNVVHSGGAGSMNNNASAIQPVVGQSNKEETVEDVIQKNKYNQSYTDLIFPSDLNQNHVIHLQFYRYKEQSKLKQENRIMDSSITLPVPLALNDQQNVATNDGELGALGGFISDAIISGKTDPMADLTMSDAETMLNSGQGLLQPFIEAGSSTRAQYDNLDTKGQAQVLAMMFSSGIRQGNNPIGVGLNRLLGVAPNPNMFAMFRAVGLKTHNLAWKLSAANEAESEILTQIINSIKYFMLPSNMGGVENLGFNFPHEVDITFMGKGENGNRHYYPFKTAIIRNASFNFNPDGTPSFFARTGAPTAVSFSIDMIETAIHTKDDYEVPRGPSPDNGFKGMSRNDLASIGAVP